MMGLNNEDNNQDDMMAMEMDLMNAGNMDGTNQLSGVGSTIAITVFIGFDEDDDNKYKIDLKQLF